MPVTASPFAGLSAFPLTPFHDDRIDEASFTSLIERCAAADVDSITALGSTGSYAYLDRDERSRAVRLAVEHAGAVPVLAGIGALRTSHVIENARAAADAGAAGLLLAPVSYQRLTDDDVFELFRSVTSAVELPVVIYDNPGTTHVTFTNELYARIAQLDGIASIKIPGVPTDPALARERVAAIRAVVPAHVSIGISVDGVAAIGMNAGCDGWYSAIGGTLPEPVVRITRTALAGRGDEALALSAQLDPIWTLFAEFGGSLRVVAAIAELLGLVPERCLPLPIQGLRGADRERVAQALDGCGLR